MTVYTIIFLFSSAPKDSHTYFICLEGFLVWTWPLCISSLFSDHMNQTLSGHTSHSKAIAASYISSAPWEPNLMPVGAGGGRVYSPSSGKLLSRRSGRYFYLACWLLKRFAAENGLLNEPCICVPRAVSLPGRLRSPESFLGSYTDLCAPPGHHLKLYVLVRKPVQQWQHGDLELKWTCFY